MTDWTPDRIIALAPDASSASSGKSLSARKSWLSVARNGDILWGECQGSGKHPYQTRIDMDEPVFKCSCPSRKFPCKHGLGLFLLYAAKPAEFTETVPPSWVAEWLEGRQNRAEKKAEKALETTSKPPDPKAQEKRTAARDKKVRAGLEEIKLFTRDLIRTGIAGVQSKGYGHWETAAARLVDAQAPGLARLVREIPTLLTRDDWQAQLLERLGLIHLAAEAYARLETLPEGARADTRSTIGFPVAGEDVLAQPGTRDTWQVVAQSSEQEDRLRARRTWLRGETTRMTALILEFGVPQAPLPAGLAVGYNLEAELAFYPSGAPLRALVKGGSTTRGAVTNMHASSIGDNLSAHATALSHNPWLERTLFTIAEATLHPDDTVRDLNGAILNVDSRFNAKWQWLAVTGGYAGVILGEWNGETFMPLSVVQDEVFHNFAFDGVTT
jgi:SWIM zinc finger